MLRRLYYLFPDVAHTQAVVDELAQLNVPRHRMHVVARKNIDIRSLPGATPRQMSDTIHHIATLGWNINLLLFFLALMALVVGVFANSPVLMIVSIIVMVATFTGGYMYTTHMPDMDLSVFENVVPPREQRGDCRKAESLWKSSSKPMIVTYH